MTQETSARQRQIEDAASSLFRERGYAATSVRDIAQALNIQGASLYAHVASKEDVLWSIVRRAADRFQAAVDPIVAAPELSPSDRLRLMVRAHVDVVTSDLGNASVFLHEWRFLSEARRAEIATRRDAYERRFREVIAEGQRTHEFLPADPAITATLILTALNGIAGWYDADGAWSAKRIADHYAALFLRALACDSSIGAETAQGGPVQ
jgi:TetR/AcrR family transcriptional regulator, cholesterol catabolism regulator